MRNNQKNQKIKKIKKITKIQKNQKIPENQKEEKAQMTVYMTLMFSVLIPLLFTMIEGARISASKLMLECVVEMGLDSILAEYHQELFQQYGLLFVDTAYGGETGSLETTKEHLEEYMTYNLTPQKGLVKIGTRDFYRLSTDQVDVLEASRATDDDGSVFEYMVGSYMLQKYGIAYVKEAADLVTASEENHLFDSDIQSELSDAQAQIDAVSLPDEEEGEEWKDMEKDNPVEGLNEYRSQGILPIVCSKAVSGRKITPDLYVSGRNLVEGNGKWEKWEQRSSLEEQLLVNEYYLLKTGNYRTPKEGSVLQYETEYLIGGKENDTDNLKAVVNKILLIRGGANSVYYAQNKEMQEEVTAAAEALSTVIMLPELAKVFEAAMAAGWIYAESLNDVKLLMDGKKVPLLKQDGEWNLGLTNAMNLTAAAIGKQEGEGSGLGYEDYLRLLLYSTDGKQKAYRCMDLIEMDLRKIKGCEDFRMDDCIAALQVQLVFESGYGQVYLMKRDAGYY